MIYDILSTNYQPHGIIYTDISDHLPIFLLTKQINDTKIDTVMETRIYHEQATFKESIDQITWDELYAFKNPKESYSKFHNEILFVYNKFIRPDYCQGCSGNKRENNSYCQSSSGNKGGRKFLLPEQKWIDGDMHACPVSDIFSEHMST